MAELDALKRERAAVLGKTDQMQKEKKMLEVQLKNALAELASLKKNEQKDDASGSGQNPDAASVDK